MSATILAVSATLTITGWIGGALLLGGIVALWCVRWRP